MCYFPRRCLFFQTPTPAFCGCVVAMSDIAIRVNNVSKVYPLYRSNRDRLLEAIHPLRKKYHTDFYALKDVSFEVKKGEAVGIIGQNGSGKSTLLKIITGVLTPTSGSVEVNGRISSLLELGTGFNPEMTGIENVFFYGSINGISREEMERRLDDILSFADIGDFVYQPVKTYSSGMFVRLAFACAINVEPDILIVDEALAVGDVRFQLKSFRKIEDFRAQNKTLLLVSHDINQLQSVTSRCVWLDRGELKSDGKTKDVTGQYVMFMHSGSFAKTQDYAPQVKPQPIPSQTRLQKAIVIDPKQFDNFSLGIATITEIHFFSPNGSLQFAGKEELCFHVFVKIHEPIYNFLIGMNLHDFNGRTVIAVNNAAYGPNLGSISPGFMKILFRFCLPLLHVGKYFFWTSIADGTQENHQPLCWVNDFLEINIVTDDMRQRVGHIFAIESAQITIDYKKVTE
ncbi:MAG: ABC transporter ATP-binding protein [Leptospiraceae bacterium]|nr:ABC transporter ATP-binding protein [Leptospiraceae bacterium]